AEGQRGFEVAQASAQNLRELAELRLLLETHALTQSFVAGDMDWEGRVVSAHHKLAATERRQQAGDHTDNETWKRYDFEFHHALISACGSDTLLEAHAPVFDKYLRYLMIAGIYRGEITAREHQISLECALKRDVARVTPLLRHRKRMVADPAGADASVKDLKPEGCTGAECPRASCCGGYRVSAVTRLGPRTP